MLAPRPMAGLPGFHRSETDARERRQTGKCWPPGRWQVCEAIKGVRKAHVREGRQVNAAPQADGGFRPDQHG